MRPILWSVLAFSLFGCRREINVNVDIKIYDTGSDSTDEPSSSSQPSEPASSQPSSPTFEPSANPQPANEPSGNPNDTGSQGNPNDTGSQGNPNDTGSQGNPNDTGSQGNPNDTSSPSDSGTPDDPGQQQGGGPDFCVLAQTAIDCGMPASLALDYCDDPATAGDWLLFLDCLVEAGATDCTTLSDCEGFIP